jgi:hypothetical protein
MKQRKQTTLSAINVRVLATDVTCGAPNEVGDSLFSNQCWGQSGNLGLLRGHKYS